MTTIKRPVLFSGENPGMTLFIPDTEQVAAIVSYWYCTDSPHGVGHALIVWLANSSMPVTEGDQGQILTDNLDLAQVLVTKLTQYFPEFQDVPIESLAYVDARCEHVYDGSSYRVVCQTPETQIEVKWANVLDRKQVIWPRFPTGETAYDLTTVICPCRVGHIWINGEQIDGEVRTGQAADGKLSSTAFLAFAETWVGPLDE